MLTIFRKEINLFLSSLIGYLVVAVFLLLTGLFVWVFPTHSILDYGYATLETMFGLAPYIFLLLIPAITMRSFAEEIDTGTIELLSTKPVRDFDIIFGKFLAAFALVVFAVLPTLIYFWSVYQLGEPKGNIDTGGTWGSYIGLLFLGGGFVSIGMFCSSVTKNQIVAFLLAVLLCFFVYDGFFYLAKLQVFWGSYDYIVEQFGMESHYYAMGKGIFDTRDAIYFLSIIFIFTSFTKISIESRKW